MSVPFRSITYLLIFGVIGLTGRLSEASEASQVPALTKADMSPTPVATPDTAHAELVPNAKSLSGIGLLGGQPSQEAFKTLASEGFKSIINMRAEPAPFDEQTLSKELEVRYHHLPIAGALGITNSNADALYLLLQDPENLPAIIHCASGNRVGALFAIMGARHYGMDADAAVAFGTATGMTRLKSVVKIKLGS